MTFPYKVDQAVAAFLPGPVLGNGTVIKVTERPDRWRDVVVRHVGPERFERSYLVSPGGTCDYMLPYPLRPTVNDDRVTRDERYTVERDSDRFVLRFEGSVIGEGETEADCWSTALRHDYQARLDERKGTGQ